MSIFLINENEMLKEMKSDKNVQEESMINKENRRKIRIKAANERNWMENYKK